jgi:hypothetical protein
MMMTSFLVARNSRKGRRLVRDWWRSVDDFGSLLANTSSSSPPHSPKTTATTTTMMRPLRHFRVGGHKEQSVLSGFMDKR